MHGIQFKFLSIIFCLFVVFSISSASLKDGEVIKIWPGTAPGSEGLKFSEVITERSSDPAKINDRAVEKILMPTLTVYKPEKPNGSAILVIPGGSYQRVVIDKEAGELAPWLNGLGITFFVLRYRLPADGHKMGMDVPLQDAMRAIRYIRNNAKSWGLDPKKIGVMGFSAGGHVASGLAVKYNQEIYTPKDLIDKENARPDFLILCYPVVTMKDPYAHKGSRMELLGANPTQEQMNMYSNELLVNKDTPQTFIIHANDDNSVPIENSINFYLALKKAMVPAELHIFLNGGHGFSIRFANGKTAENWTLLCGRWMKAIGAIK